MGADRAVRFWDDAFNCVYNDLTGRVLARLIRHFSFDLVFCGRQASDDDMGHTGYAIAAQLGIPFIQKAVKIEISREGTATISSKLEGGKREMIEVGLPAVVGIERDINEPRYAGLPALIAALREDIVQIDLKEIGMSAPEIDSRVKCIGISPPRPRPKKIFKPDSSLSAADRLRLIMSGGLAEKKEELFEGSPEDLSQKFVQFLNQEKILQQN